MCVIYERLPYLTTLFADSGCVAENAVSSGEMAKFFECRNGCITVLFLMDLLAERVGGLLGT